MTCIFGDVCYISAATFLRDFIYACCLRSIEDVTSISWIFVLFACIIALIEVGRYANFFMLIWRKMWGFLDWLERSFIFICYITNTLEHWYTWACQLGKVFVEAKGAVPLHRHEDW